MTPRLLPYTWFRHVVPGLVAGMAGLLAWWATLLIVAWQHSRYDGPTGRAILSPEAEGALWFAMVAAATAASSVVLEGRFARTRLRRRLGAGLFAGLVAAAFTALVARGWSAGVSWMGWMPAGTLALRWRIAPWLAAGLGAALGMLAVRLGRHLLDRLQRRWEIELFDPPPPLDGSPWAIVALHALCGPAAGGLAAVVWYALGLWLDDLYLAGAAGSFVLATVAGALAWGIPGAVWQPWVHVRVGARPGWRIPLDPTDVALQERFIGHFPSGMDLHLPGTDGVTELHLSVLARGDGDALTLAARGLSQAAVTVIRPFERVELAYDPRLPAPLETLLHHEDRVRLGPVAEVEVLVLSREGTP